VAAGLSCSPGDPGQTGITPTSTTSEVDEAATVVRLQVNPCLGNLELKATGVAVSADTIATVAHSFDGARDFSIIDHTGRHQRGDLVWMDEERDLALVQTEEPLPWLQLGDSADGDPVEVITAAPDDGLETKAAVVVQHVVATLDGEGQRQAIEIEADIQGGDSGAPVINTGGEVIGLVFATARGTDRGWVLAASEIETALAQPKDDPIPLTC
jgi:S1-C subfamily serine protease